MSHSPACRPFTERYDRAEQIADAVMHAEGFESHIWVAAAHARTRSKNCLSELESPPVRSAPPGLSRQSGLA